MLRALWSALFMTSKPSESYPRWPTRGGEESWMRGKIAYYRKHYPDLAYFLFDISCADYMPLSIHVSGNFGVSELAIYRRLKEENPDLVEQAACSTGHLYSRSRVYDPADCPDVPMYS